MERVIDEYMVYGGVKWISHKQSLKLRRISYWFGFMMGYLSTAMIICIYYLIQYYY
jgi:hypothetical protein